MIVVQEIKKAFSGFLLELAIIEGIRSRCLKAEGRGLSIRTCFQD